MRTLTAILISIALCSVAFAGQTITVTSKDGKVTKQVVTTSTEVTETDAVTAETDLSDAKSRLTLLQALADIDVSDKEALDLFYYMEKLPFAQKAKLEATLAAEIAAQDDLVKKLEAALKP